MKTHYTPRGTKFFDNASKRQMMLCHEGQFKDWILYKHPDGQWVSLRKATDKDVSALANAVSKQFHAL